MNECAALRPRIGSRSVAAARLTVLAGAPGILIVSSLATLGHGDAIVPTEGELAAAARRDEARRAAWAKYRIEVDARVSLAWRAKSVLIVSAEAAKHAIVLRAGQRRR